MNTSDTIRQRRSIRRYKKKTPLDADLEKVLEAARWAPSGLNNQPWKFMLIRDKAKKDGLAGFTKYGDIIKGAPLVIAVFMDIADSYNRDKDLMAIGASIQNIMLQSYEIGLGSCWLGEILNKKEEVMRYLNLGEGLELTAVVALGYPDEKPAARRRKALKDMLIGGAAGNK